jgi:hypothetical protein
MKEAVMASVSARTTMGTTEYTIEADELEEVEDAIARIVRSYHPMGYGTHFHRPEQRADGSWVARGHRANSCD